MSTRKLLKWSSFKRSSLENFPRIIILNMGILKRSSTNHTSGLIDESNPRTLIGDSNLKQYIYRALLLSTTNRKNLEGHSIHVIIIFKAEIKPFRVVELAPTNWQNKFEIETVTLYIAQPLYWPIQHMENSLVRTS